MSMVRRKSSRELSGSEKSETRRLEINTRLFQHLFNGDRKGIYPILRRGSAGKLMDEPVSGACGVPEFFYKNDLRIEKIRAFFPEHDCRNITAGDNDVFFRTVFSGNENLCAKRPCRNGNILLFRSNDPFDPCFDEPVSRPDKIFIPLLK